MAEALSGEEREEILDGLTRPQRLLLKRAYAKTMAKPLVINGQNMMSVSVSMVGRHFAEWVTVRPPRLVLSKKGFEVASLLRVQGWPNTEKPRG